jgi:hypothetical protein
MIPDRLPRRRTDRDRWGDELAMIVASKSNLDEQAR